MKKWNFLFLDRSVDLGQFAYPAMTLIGAFVPEVSSKTIYFLYSITIGLFIYIFITVKYEFHQQQQQGNL